jgi:hypothetical protein
LPLTVGCTFDFDKRLIARRLAAWPGPVRERGPRSSAHMRILVLNYEYPPLGGGAGVATAGRGDHLRGYTGLTA